MKKLFLMAVMSTMLFSCKKEEGVKPISAETQTAASEPHSIDYFTQVNLPGTWTRTREVINGPSINIDHATTEMEIPVTLTSWYSVTNEITISNQHLIIGNYSRLGSSTDWTINWSTNDAFCISNYVEDGIYAGTYIADYYERVLN